MDKEIEKEKNQIPNPQSPIPNPQSPINFLRILNNKIIIKLIKIKCFHFSNYSIISNYKYYLTI